MKFTTEKWLNLVRLYRDEGIDVSIRKAADSLGTTHTKLLKHWGSKEGVLQEAYVQATVIHFRDMLDRPRYVNDKNATTSVRKAIMIGQAITSMHNGYGSFSMQLWARPKLHSIILSAIPRALEIVAKDSGRTAEQLGQSLFDGGISEQKQGEDISDFSRLFLRTAVTLFMGCDGINLVKVMGHHDASPGELKNMETTFFQDIERFI